ncbi:cold-inducible RNA-binding protein [Tanacetum coccineum]
MQAHISSQIQNAIDNAIPSLVDASVRSYMSGHILHVHPAQVQSSSIPEQQHQLYLAMKADPLLQQQDIAIWLALQMKFEKTQVPQTACRYSAVRTRDQDDPHDDAHPEGENSAKRQKTSEYEAYVSGESSSGQVNVEEPGPSTSGNQEQDDEFDFWTDSYASDDDEIPTKQMKNFLQSDIVWESRKEILVSPHPRKITPLVQSCQRDPEAPALSLINQDLLYLKKGNSGPEKIVFDSIGLLSYVQSESIVIWEKSAKHFNLESKLSLEDYVSLHQQLHSDELKNMMVTLEGLKSYNNDVKYGYMQKELTNDEVKFLKLFKEEIEVRLDYQDQMRRWEIYIHVTYQAFNALKKKLTEAPILVAPDWDLPFKIMYDASDFVVGAVLGQQKELLAVVYAFEKFRPYLVLLKTIVYTDHSALKYLLAKHDAKPRLLRWILLL